MCLVSVCMCTYNRANDIKKTIECIINQTYRNIEFIIIDDGSTDNTEEVVKSYNDDRIKYIKCEHNFINSRNESLRHVSGKYIKFIDSGDIINIDCIKDSVDYLEKHEYIDGLINSNRHYTDTIQDEGELFREYKFAYTWVGIPASLFFKSSFLDYFNRKKYYFDEFKIGGEDQQFIKMLIRFGAKIHTISSKNTNYIINKNCENPSNWNLIESVKMIMDDLLLITLYNKYNK